MDLYLPLKHLHLSLAALSISGFALRWLAVLGGAAWPLSRPWRVGTALLDAMLLAAGAGLWGLLQLNPLQQTWLGVKLLWLLAYIVCGSFALKRARTRGGKLLAGLLALGCVALLVATALRHTPTPWSAA